MAGFTGYDAEFLTSLAKQYSKRKFLSPKQISKLHKVMPKYWRQLLDVSDKNKLEKSYLCYMDRKELEKEQGEFEFNTEDG